MQSLEVLFAHYPKAQIKESGKKYLNNGNPLSISHLVAKDNYEDGHFIRIYNENNQFVALYKWNAERQMLEVEKMFMVG